MKAAKMWEFVERIGGHRYWRQWVTEVRGAVTHNRWMYNCTNDDTPPKTDGGWYNLDALKIVKGDDEGFNVTAKRLAKLPKGDL